MPRSPRASTRKKAAAKKRGRPSAFRPEYAEQTYKLCLLGATDATLADFFGVSTQTINAWKKAQPDFLDAMKRGKSVADANVAHSLYHRAIGYEHEAVKILTVARGGNTGSDIEEVPYIERYPPDTAAAFIWLKNRQPAQWRDKQEVEHSGAVPFIGGVNVYVDGEKVASTHDGPPNGA